MEKIKSLISLEKVKQIKTWSLRKKIIFSIILVVLIFIIFIVLKPKDNSKNITTDFAKIVNLKQTVLATGQVTSKTDLNLSFSVSGVVRSLKVKVGDKVKKGDILATLDQGNELAALTQARGVVASAEAKYKRTIDGASNEEIKLSEIALENAKRDFERQKAQQEILVKNAYKNLLNSKPEALLYDEKNEYERPIITGSFNKEKEGDIIVSIYKSNGGYSFNTEGLVASSGIVSELIPQPIGDSGLFISFPDINSVYITRWIISIPNKKALDYVANNNAYQAALKNQETVLGGAQSLIDQREAELALKKSSARQVDVDLAKADILTAQGQLQLASSNFEHTILRAPADGTITKVDVKIGELAQALKSVMVLQDVNDIYLEANINEANINSIKINAPVDITFDAFNNTDKIFKGNILNIEPSSTIISGVVNYKITANVLDNPELRPGMTANMTILVNEKDNILSIPTRAILKDKNGEKTVRLVTNSKTKEYKEVEIATGMEGDGGLTEIISGLKDGDEVVLLIKK